MPCDAIGTNYTVPLCGRKLRMSKCVTRIYLGLGDATSNIVVVVISLLAVLSFGGCFGSFQPNRLLNRLMSPQNRTRLGRYLLVDRS